jgi:hypothetical protein
MGMGHVMTKKRLESRLRQEPILTVSAPEGGSSSACVPRTDRKPLFKSSMLKYSTTLGEEFHRLHFQLHFGEKKKKKTTTTCLGRKNREPIYELILHREA